MWQLFLILSLLNWIQNLRVQHGVIPKSIVVPEGTDLSSSGSRSEGATSLGSNLQRTSSFKEIVFNYFFPP